MLRTPAPNSGKFVPRTRSIDASGAQGALGKNAGDCQITGTEPTRAGGQARVAAGCCDAASEGVLANRATA